MPTPVRGGAGACCAGTGSVPAKPGRGGSTGRSSTSIVGVSGRAVSTIGGRDPRCETGAGGAGGRACIACGIDRCAAGRCAGIAIGPGLLLRLPVAFGRNCGATPDSMTVSTGLACLGGGGADAAGAGGGGGGRATATRGAGAAARAAASIAASPGPWTRETVCVDDRGEVRRVRCNSANNDDDGGGGGGATYGTT